MKSKQYIFHQCPNGPYYTVNAYYDGLNWRRMVDGTASLVFLCRATEGPQFRIYDAPQGVAESAIEWTMRFKFDWNDFSCGSDLIMTDDRFLKIGLDSDGELPTPDETYRGKMIRVEGGPGEADKLYVCMKAADESYSWVQIASG